MSAGLRFFDKPLAQGYDAKSYDEKMQQNMREAIEIQTNLQALQTFEKKLKERLLKLKNNIKSDHSDLDNCSESDILTKLKINSEAQRKEEQRKQNNSLQRNELMQQKKKAEEADVKKEAENLFKTPSASPFKSCK